MSNRRADDIGMALVRALRSEADVARNARVERAIDNQGNPIMDNVTLVAGGPGGTVIVTWAAIQGDPEDNTALAAALEGLESQITESTHTHANKAILDGMELSFTNFHADFLQAVVTEAVRVGNTDASGWAFVVDEDDMASNSGTKLPTQQSVKAYVDNNAGDGHTHDNKATLDLIDVPYDTARNNALAAAVVHGNSTDNPHEVTAAQVGAAEEEHTHNASDINAGTLAIARIPTGTSGSTVALGNHTHSDLHTHSNKAILDATEEAFTNFHVGILQGLVNHASNTSNPHSVTAAQVGAAATSHTHNASAITAGTISPARLPSGSMALATQVSTTSTSPQTVTALNIAAAANATYEVTYLVQCGCDGAGGMRIGVTAPSGSSVTRTIRMSSEWGTNSDWIDTFGVSTLVGTTNFAVNAVIDGTTPVGAAQITAIVHTGGSSGNISLQYRSTTSGQTSIIGTGTKVSWVRTG